MAARARQGRRERGRLQSGRIFLLLAVHLTSVLPRAGQLRILKRGVPRLIGHRRQPATSGRLIQKGHHAAPRHFLVLRRRRFLSLAVTLPDLCLIQVFERALAF